MFLPTAGPDPLVLDSSLPEKVTENCCPVKSCKRLCSTGIVLRDGVRLPPEVTRLIGATTMARLRKCGNDVRALELQRIACQNCHNFASAWEPGWIASSWKLWRRDDALREKKSPFASTIGHWQVTAASFRTSYGGGGFSVGITRLRSWTVPCSAAAKSGQSDAPLWRDSS